MCACMYGCTHTYLHMHICTSGNIICMCNEGNDEYEKFHTINAVTLQRLSNGTPTNQPTNQPTIQPTNVLSWH